MYKVQNIKRIEKETWTLHRLCPLLRSLYDKLSQLKLALDVRCPLRTGDL